MLEVSLDVGAWRGSNMEGAASLSHAPLPLPLRIITAIAIGHEFSNNTPIIFIYSCFVNLFVALVQSECCVQARMNYRLIKLSSPYSY